MLRITCGETARMKSTMGASEGLILSGTYMITQGIMILGMTLLCAGVGGAICRFFYAVGSKDPESPQ